MSGTQKTCSITPLPELVSSHQWSLSYDRGEKVLHTIRPPDHGIVLYHPQVDMSEVHNIFMCNPGLSLGLVPFINDLGMRI